MYSLIEPHVLSLEATYITPIFGIRFCQNDIHGIWDTCELNSVWVLPVLLLTQYFRSFLVLFSFQRSQRTPSNASEPLQI